jgi:hypothetical protein
MSAIKSSWDAVEIPSGSQHVGGSTGTGEGRYCHETYADRHWLDVAESSFSPNYGAITMMLTDAARAYYVGSYIYSFLSKYLNPESNRYEFNADVFEALQTVLDNLVRRGTAASVFTSQQLLAVVEFLQTFELLDSSVSDTLRNYKAIISG